MTNVRLSDKTADLLLSRLDWDSPAQKWRWITVKGLMTEILEQEPTRLDIQIAAIALSKMNGIDKRRSNGRYLKRLPPVRQ